MNVILIISDTFRRDHLGCYGNSWIRTPHLDRFAAKAVVFDRCYAASFPTMPNRADLLTGKHTFTYLGWAPLPHTEITLPALLAEAGYLTMGIVDTPFYTRKGYGYDRGFSDFVWIRGQGYGPEHRDVTRLRRYEEDYFAPKTLVTAERWLEGHYKDRFFLLVDTWDPHEPWDPPDHYVEMYQQDHDGRLCAYPCYWDWRDAGLSEEDVKKAHAHYCAEVTMVDRAVGRLLERIESLGLMDDTAIIFTSDHGFYFGERGQFGKARTLDHRGVFRMPAHDPISTVDVRWHWSPLYDEVAGVPLLIYLPQADPTRQEALASSPDLMPTILQLAGLEIPEAVQASSLVPLLHGEQDRVHDHVVTSWPLYSPGQSTRVVDNRARRIAEWLPATITDGEWTLLYAAEGEPAELYHTASDPKQEKNVFEDNELIARELHVQLVRFLEKVGTDESLLAPRRRLR